MKYVMKDLFIVIALTLIVLSVPLTSMAAEDGMIEKEEENFVVNGDCLQGLTGWVDSEDLWQISGGLFVPKSVASATMYQDILIEDISIGTELKLSANMVCADQSPSDVGILKLEYLNDDKTKVLSSKSISHASPTLSEESVSMAVPEEAKYARVTLHGDRYSGKDLDTGFKDIKLCVVTYEKENNLKVVMEVKEKLQLSVEDNLDENLNMTWTSSDEGVATIDENGVVTALKKGHTIIKVISKDGTYTDKIHILVVEDALELRLALDMKVGMKRRVTIDDLTDTKPVKWTSMDSEIATIDAKGKITAVKKGLVLITATDENGDIVGTIYVRVRN